MQAVGILDRAAFRFYCFDLFHRWCSCLDYRVSFLLSSINSISFPFDFFSLSRIFSFISPATTQPFSYFTVSVSDFFSPLIPLSIIWKKKQIVDFFPSNFRFQLLKLGMSDPHFRSKNLKLEFAPNITFKKLRETFEVISLKKKLNRFFFSN